MQYQERPLLLDRDQPVRIPQQQPLPVTPASGASVTAVANDVDDLDTRVTTAESAITTLEAFMALLTSLDDYADDTAAAGGGVGIGEFYRNGSALMVRAA